MGRHPLPRSYRSCGRRRIKRSSGRRTSLGAAVPLADHGTEQLPQGSDPEYARRGHPDHDGNQIRWLNNNGGLAWATTRCAKSASILYSWAERSEYAAPFVVDADARSNAVVTIDLDERVQASQVLSILRENGIVDAAGYRKLGRNQLRVGVFPSVEPADVMAFTKCVDYVVEHL